MSSYHARLETLSETKEATHSRHPWNVKQHKQMHSKTDGQCLMKRTGLFSGGSRAWVWPRLHVKRGGRGFGGAHPATGSASSSSSN